MAILFVQYLAIYRNENCPIASTFYQSGLRILGCGCGTVGSAVASDTRGPGFESSHRQLLLNIYLLLTVCRKDENKEKYGELHLN